VGVAVVEHHRAAEERDSEAVAFVGVAIGGGGCRRMPVAAPTNGVIDARRWRARNSTIRALLIGLSFGFLF
jgi:hypothetical protein